MGFFRSLVDRVVRLIVKRTKSPGAWDAGANCVLHSQSQRPRFGSTLRTNYLVRLVLRVLVVRGARLFSVFVAV